MGYVSAEKCRAAGVFVAARCSRMLVAVAVSILPRAFLASLQDWGALQGCMSRGLSSLYQGSGQAIPCATPLMSVELCQDLPLLTQAAMGAHHLSFITNPLPPKRVY